MLTLSSRYYIIYLKKEVRTSNKNKKEAFYMVLHYLENGSITMKLNIGGKIFNEFFYSEVEYKKFILSL